MLRRFCLPEHERRCRLCVRFIRYRLTGSKGMKRLRSEKKTENCSLLYIGTLIMILLNVKIVRREIFG